MQLLMLTQRAIPFVAIILVACSLQPLQADIVIRDEPEGFSTLVQGQARRGRRGWEAKLFTPANDPEIDAPGIPFWDPDEYYNFQLNFDGSAGLASWWIDVNQDSAISTGELVSVTDSSMQGQSVNHVRLYLEGRPNFTEQAFVRGLSINGNAIPGTFGSGVGISDTFFTTTQAIDWAQVEVSGQMRLSWETRSNGGTQERPRVWVSLGNGVSVIPEPPSGWLIGSMAFVFATHRRRD